MKNSYRWGVIVLSLVPTPLLVFVSSSSALYLRNQGSLHYRPEVLYPFGLAFFLTLALGLLCQAFSRYRPVRSCLSGYYALGPVFLVFVFCRNQFAHVPFMARSTNTVGGLLLWTGLLLATAIVLHLWPHPRKVVKFSAALGALLVAAEAMSFHSNFERPVSSRAGSIPISLSRDPDRSLPNIYHIVLDGFQTDFFERALTPEATAALEGFTYYPANQSIYHTTFMSMASVFTGRKFSYDRPRYEYVREAFNARASFLYWLKKNGYTTLAYLPGSKTGVRRRVSPPQLSDLLDTVVASDLQISEELIAVNTAALWNLWLYSSLPDPLRKAAGRKNWFAGLDKEDLRMLQRQRLLNRSEQVASYLGFQNTLREEKDLPESNRYTYIHVMIPHWPYNLRPDCSFNNDGKTGPVEQSQCALKMIEDFVNLLKSLDRFDRSMILIHADHGAFYRVRDDVLIAVERSRSQRALLLIKPFNRKAGHRLVESSDETTLLDIKSILLRGVAGVQADRDLSGGSMTGTVRQPRLTPYIEGETLPSARRILEQQGFTLGRVFTVHSPIYAAGKVIAQDPTPYEDSDDRSQVAVLLSKGNSEDANLMPDFVGRKIADVINEVIERARSGSFPATRIHYVEHGSATRGTVVAQAPAPAARVGDHHQIELYISKRR